MNKLKEILEKTGLSPSEVQLIKKVVLISVICSATVVAGVYMFHYFSLNPIEKISTIDELESQNLNPIPLDILAHTQIAQSLLSRGKPEEAIPYLRRAFYLSDKNVLIQYHLAVALLEAGYFKESYSNLSRLIATDLPDSLKKTVSIKTGVALFYMGEIEQSTAKLKECIAQYPNSAEALCFMGQIESYLSSDTTKIRSLFEQTVQLDSLFVEGWYQLGRFEMAQGDTFAARKHLLFALELNPLHIKSHARLGMIYFYMGNRALAISSYRTTLALNPADFNTRYNLGELLYTTGDTIAALKEFTQTLVDNPDHTEANFRVGLISMRNNMFKEAIRNFEKALDQDHSNIRILLQLAVSFEKLGLTSDAINTYNRILAMDELHPIAHQKVKLLTQRSSNSTSR